MFAVLKKTILHVQGGGEGQQRLYDAIGGASSEKVAECAFKQSHLTVNGPDREGTSVSQ